MVIIVLRRYDDANLNTVDTGFITSEDGRHWSGYKMLPATEGLSNQPFGEFVVNVAKEYFLLAFEKGVIKKISSEDSFTDQIESTTIINDSMKIHF